MSTSFTPEQTQQLGKACKEISNALARAEGEKDLIRETINKVSADLKIPKKLVSKLAKTYHKKNFDQEEADHDTFVKLYKSVVK